MFFEGWCFNPPGHTLDYRHHGTAARVADSKSETSRKIMLRRGPVVPFVLFWLCLIYANGLPKGSPKGPEGGF